MNDDCFNCDKPECIGGKLGCTNKDKENAKRRERYHAKKKERIDENKLERNAV